MSYVIDIILIALVLGAVYTDLRARRVPNWQTMPALVLGLGLNALVGGFDGLLSSLIAASMVLGLLLIPWLLGGLGAGDVKLLMAVGALKGSPFILWALSYAAIAGGLLAIVLIIKRKSILRILRYALSLGVGLATSSLGHYFPQISGTRVAALEAEKPGTLKATLPAGLAIAAGAMAALYLQYFSMPLR